MNEFGSDSPATTALEKSLKNINEPPFPSPNPSSYLAGLCSTCVFDRPEGSERVLLRKSSTRTNPLNANTLKSDRDQTQDTFDFPIIEWVFDETANDTILQINNIEEQHKMIQRKSTCGGKCSCSNIADKLDTIRICR
jgi:hypothetical protein